jgi:hypothetical protein
MNRGPTSKPIAPPIADPNTDVFRQQCLRSIGKVFADLTYGSRSGRRSGGRTETKTALVTTTVIRAVRIPMYIEQFLQSCGTAPPRTAAFAGKTLQRCRLAGADADGIRKCRRAPHRHVARMLAFWLRLATTLVRLCFAHAKDGGKNELKMFTPSGATRHEWTRQHRLRGRHHDFRSSGSVRARPTPIDTVHDDAARFTPDG